MTQFVCNSSPIFQKGGVAVLCPVAALGTFPMASLSTLSLDELTTLYDTELRKLIDALAPTKTRTITIRPESEWYNESIREAKQTRRQAERLWRKTGLVVHSEL